MSYVKLPLLVKNGFNIIAIDTEQDEDANPYVWCVGGFYNNKVINKVFYNKNDCVNYLFRNSKEWDHVILTGMNVLFDLNTMIGKDGLNWDIIENQGSFITARPQKQKKVKGKKLTPIQNHLTLIELSHFFPGQNLISIIKNKDWTFRKDYLEFLEIIKNVSGKDFCHIDKHILGKDGDINEMADACISHAFAACYALHDIQKQIRYFGSNLEITPALTAQKLHRRKFLHHDCQIMSHHSKHITPEVKLFMNDSYFGGRTENFIKSSNETIIKNVSGIDLNSSYPTSMKNKSYPDVITYREVNPPHLSSLKKYMDDYEGMAEVRIKSPDNQKIMLLPKILNSRLTFPAGEWQGVYTFPELRKAIEEGYKIKKVFSVGICKPTKQPFFAEYINKLYELKNDSRYRAIAKLMLNSLYGKFGQKANEMTGWHIMDENDIPENLEINLDTMIKDEGGIKINKEEYAIFNNLIMKYIPSSPIEERGFSKTAYPLIAAYVTSYSRILLYDAMKAIGENHIYYCDTDSIYCDSNALKIAINQGKIDIDSKKLGKWDIEHDNCQLEVRGLKYYRIMENEYDFINLCGGDFDFDIHKGTWDYTIKGVPSKIHPMFWKHKHATIKRVIKRATAIRFGKKINKFVDITKSDQTPDTKRFFDNDLNSSPLICNEYL